MTRKVNQMMTTDVQVVGPDATIQEAAQFMRDLDVGSLPVCDGRLLLGMITDRDITVRATADGRNPTDTLAIEMMTPGVLYCFDDDNLDDVSQIMAKNQIRRLPVLNHDKQLVGIISLGDVAVEGNKDAESGKTLEQISEMHHAGQR